MRVPAARGKCPVQTWKNWRRRDGELSLRVCCLLPHVGTEETPTNSWFFFSPDNYGPRSCLIGVHILSHANSGLLFSSRYLSEHGYSAATDSGNIVDMQKIVKRLLDVRIKRLRVNEQTMFRMSRITWDMCRREDNWQIVRSSIWGRSAVGMETLIRVTSCYKYRRYVISRHPRETRSLGQLREC